MMPIVVGQDMTPVVEMQLGNEDASRRMEFRGATDEMDSSCSNMYIGGEDVTHSIAGPEEALLATVLQHTPSPSEDTLRTSVLQAESAPSQETSRTTVLQLAPAPSEETSQTTVLQAAPAPSSTLTAWEANEPAPAMQPGEEEVSEEIEIPAFKPLPGFFIFPNLQILPCWLFHTGLTKRATALLIYQLEAHEFPKPSCGAGCTVLSIAVLAWVLCVLGMTLFLLLRFNRDCRKECWKPTAKPSVPQDVSDPIFRLWSRIKRSVYPWLLACLCVKRESGATLKPVERVSGKWGKPPGDMAEPARTERLLSRHFVLRRQHAADRLDQMSLCVFGKTTGRNFLGVAFAWLGMAIQVGVAVLAGMGAFLTASGWPADAQMTTISGIKLGWVAVLVCLQPCACRLTNTVVALQFLCEGMSGALLLLAKHLGDDKGALTASITFWMLLGPVFFPVMMKAYDGVFINIVTQCCRKKFDPVKTIFTALIFLLALPALAMKMLGLGGGATDGTSSEASKTVGKMGGTMKALVTDLVRVTSQKKSKMKRSTSTLPNREGRKKVQDEEEMADDAGGDAGD